MTSLVRLRDVLESDLPVFFDHQRDPQANRVASFPPRSWDAFMTHWREKIFGDELVIKQTILCGDQVAGNIVCFRDSDRWLVGYWIGREFWGQGVATLALATFLDQISMRPLEAYVAADNIGSIRVLQKNGFAEVASGGLASERAAVEELQFRLN